MSHRRKLQHIRIGSLLLFFAANPAWAAPTPEHETKHFVVFAAPSTLEDHGVAESDLRQCGGWLETAHDTAVNRLGFREPWAARYRGKMKVTIRDFGPSRASTLGNITDNGELHLNARSFFETGDKPHNRGKRLLPATIAHELFHAIQYGYDRLEEAWIMDATAQWFEEQAFPDVNDYVANESILLDFPHYSLHHPRFLSGDTTDYGRFGRAYGPSIFFRFLSAQPGQEKIVRTIWEHCGAKEGPNGLEAVFDAVTGKPVGEVTTVGSGAPLIAIEPDSPAAEAGIEAGDSIVTFNSYAVDSPEQLLRLIRESEGLDITLSVVREKKLFYAQVRLPGRDSPRRGRVGYLGVKVDRDAGDPVSDSQKPVVVLDREPAAAFETATASELTAFRRVMERFAVGTVLMSEAPGDSAIPEADAFREASGAPIRARRVDLSKAWEAHYRNDFEGPDTARRTFSFASSTRPDEWFYGWIGGLGTRCFKISPLPDIPSPTALDVFIPADEGELSIQGLANRDPAGGWDRYAAVYDRGSNAYHLHIPQIDDLQEEACIVVTRYSDSIREKVFPITLAAVEPPVLREIVVRAGDMTAYHAVWEDAKASGGAVAKRAGDVKQENPADMLAAGGEVSLTFTHPVEPIPTQPICTINGTVDVELDASDDGRTWSGRIPSGHVSTVQKILVNAQTAPEGTRAAIPLDEDPTTVASLGLDAWRGYEREGPGMLIELGSGVPDVSLAGKWWAFHRLSYTKAKKNHRPGQPLFVVDLAAQEQFLGYKPDPPTSMMITKDADGYQGVTSSGEAYRFEPNGVDAEERKAYFKMTKEGRSRETPATLSLDGDRWTSSGGTIWISDDLVQVIE